MTKSNIHKKVTREDKFARKHYCQRAALKITRLMKRCNRRAFRRWKEKEE